MPHWGFLYEPQDVVVEWHGWYFILDTGALY